MKDKELDSNLFEHGLKFADKDFLLSKSTYRKGVEVGVCFMVSQRTDPEKERNEYLNNA